MKRNSSLPIVVGLTAALFTFIGFQMAPSDKQINGDAKLTTNDSDWSNKNTAIAAAQSLDDSLAVARISPTPAVAIEQLTEQQAKARIVELEQQLSAQQLAFEQQLLKQQHAFEQENTTLANELRQSQDAVEVAQIMSDHQHNDEKQTEPLIAKDEITPYLEVPFVQVIENGSAHLIDNFRQLNQENTNYAWSALMEQQIRDYIVTHNMAADVTIENVRCANNACEVTGFEHQEASWRAITSQMEVQSWWDFHSTHSNTSSEKNGDTYFYLLAAKALDAN